MLTADAIFCSAAVPLEDVKDPTGAGDAFAGGVLGYLASRNATTADAMRPAIAYGTVVASFVVQGFGVEPIRNLERPELDARFETLRDLTHFESLDAMQSAAMPSSAPRR
jgi:sugar/nucleoside kinase (ribokinase family)